MAYPKQVPLLEADDIHKGFYVYEERCCLEGWCAKVFGKERKGLFGLRPIDKEGQEVERRLLAKAKEMKLHSPYGRYVALPEINDSDKNSEQQLADVWNAVMADLGYTEIFEYEEKE